MSLNKVILFYVLLHLILSINSLNVNKNDSSLSTNSIEDGIKSVQKTITLSQILFGKSRSRQSRQVIPTTAILLPNVGQYLALIQILVLALVIYTQIMRLLGIDYVGKGIKSIVPLSEQQDLDEILDYDDLDANSDLVEKKKRRRKTLFLK